MTMHTQVLFNTFALAVASLAFFGCAHGSGGGSAVDVGVTVITPGESYDAEMLFERGLEAQRAERYVDALADYDRVESEFEGSAWQAPALFNAALCARALGQNRGAIERLERFVHRFPDHEDVRAARFLMAQALMAEGEPDAAIAHLDRLMADRLLPPAERLEAMARRAEALFVKRDLDAAEVQAANAVVYYRIRRAGRSIPNGEFAAAAKFVYAEVETARMHDTPLDGATESFALALDRRARHLLNAQQRYFEVMDYRIDRWTARAGQRVGQNYEDLWRNVVEAPIPAPRSEEGASERETYEATYREIRRRFAKPFLRHAIRYWEMTLSLTERSAEDHEAIRTRIAADRDRVQTVLAGEPVGPEGMDAIAEAEAALRDSEGVRESVREDR